MCLVLAFKSLQGSGALGSNHNSASSSSDIFYGVSVSELARESLHRFPGER